MKREFKRRGGRQVRYGSIESSGTARVTRYAAAKENLIFAPVAELADAYGSGPYFRKEVQVRFLSGAPKRKVTHRVAFSFCSIHFFLFSFHSSLKQFVTFPDKR